MEQLHALAQVIGIAREWWDVDGNPRTVSDLSLARIAGALGYPADDPAAIAHSLAQARREAEAPPLMIVTEVGMPIALPASLVGARLTAEDGRAVPLASDDWTLPPVAEPGYYRLSVAGHQLTLAVAPRSCPTAADFADRRMWGPAVQIPALQGASVQPFGTFAELDEAVRLFAARGADLLAINPVHALFPGNGIGFSPYSPSSRLHFNTAMGAPELLGLPPLPERPGPALIDWETALPRRLADLRTLHASLDAPTRARIAAESAADDAAGGDGLRQQALFDALDVHFRAQGADGWRQWPEAYRDPASPAVQDFAARHGEEIAFHRFAQWLARESLGRVQQHARAAGMAVGLVADLAVGVHLGGADAWALGDAMLQGLTIGAPPDPLGPQGQNWMLTGFSPRGLRRTGHAPWIAMIRSALERAGGLRIDHAFGLSRLWVIPEGEGPAAGAYLSYPFLDLVRLAALEAHRAQALIVAEDLGTMPGGFAGPVAAARMHGMRVLWFERAQDDGFIGGQDYPVDSVAMTGTHDTATVAGWWSGRDLDWAERLGRLPSGVTPAMAAQQRDWDRGLLWATLTHDREPRPAATDPAPVVAAALHHIGASASSLAIAPLEDLLAETEQPNLPGTITEHPNWRRRIAAPLADLLDDPAHGERVAALDRARQDRGPAR